MTQDELDLARTLAALDAAATPGKWELEEDPLQDGDHATLCALPDKSGFNGTWLFSAVHNWNDAGAGERRISWKGAESNVALIVALVNAYRSGQLAPMPDVETVARDAARYRWLRDHSTPPHQFYISVPDKFHGVKFTPDDVDAYIDAAIAAMTGGKHE